MVVIEKITSPFRPQTSGDPNIAPPKRYRRLWRFTIIMTMMITFIPLGVMTMVNYHHDQKAYDAEMSYMISQILSNTKRTLEFIMEERMSALALIVREKPFSELADDDCLTSTLRSLKQSFGGFVDLGLIDSNGNQLNYSGPYDLKGKNYKNQSWFHQVYLRGIYVSDVFMGYRNFPHFVITIKYDKEDRDYFVLRATIDMDLINRQIYSLDLEETTDAFIINQNGVLQTASKFYGGLLEESGIDVPTHSRNSVVISESKRGNRRQTQGYAYIKDTPFILMASAYLQNPFQHWASRRSELLWFLGITIVILTIVIIYRSTYMVNRLRASDERHAKTLHNIEYTNKMATIGRMAASVAHEINNPLAIINEKAGLMKDMVSFSPDFPKREKSLDLLTAIENSVERCSKVTHRLLGFSRRMDIRKELIDLENLMREVVSFIGKEAEHRNISVNYNIEINVPSIDSDRGQLQQVFLNIVNNAIAAVKDGGRIDISVRSEDHRSVSVSIADDGSGIPKENLKHIFEPFFSTKGEFGTGLGLSITKEIIDKLGGRIEVVSELNKGTCFTITLPLRT